MKHSSATVAACRLKPRTGERFRLTATAQTAPMPYALCLEPMLGGSNVSVIDPSLSPQYASPSRLTCVAEVPDQKANGGTDEGTNDPQSEEEGCVSNEAIHCEGRHNGLHRK